MDIVIGRKKNEAAIDSLIADIESLNDQDATLYIGYPILAIDEDSITLAAVLVSQIFGFVVFDLPPNPDSSSDAEIRDRHDAIVRAVRAKLFNYKDLSVGRDLGFEVNVFTYFPAYPHWAASTPAPEVVSSSDFEARLRTSKPLAASFVHPLNAAIQRVSSLRPKLKRENVTKETSYGAVLKKIEKQIAELDSWQKSAAIETPDGPQRIRGLAGSGKTIVLALKAAYLHAEYPNWKIAVTFYTRALRQQFIRLIRKFYFEDRREEPDWEKLQIIHAFGSQGQPGIYSEICAAYGVPTRDFGYAKRTYGYDKSFEGICQELLREVEQRPEKKELFDVLLIDEAQDMPKEFLRLAYHSTARHRFTWAYDDLQNLGAYQTETLRAVFGVDASGNDRVRLPNVPKQARQDIILPRCYRNTPWALVAAHALGSGVYRVPTQQGQPILIQHPDDPQLWSEIGYRVVSGRLALGENITLERDPNASPSFFLDLLNEPDAVKFLRYEDDIQQLSDVAERIRRNIEEDELYPHDILVIFPDALEAAQRGNRLRQYLADRGVASNIAGVTSGVEDYSVDGNVTISGPYRAKGNEAPMVYAMDSQYGALGGELLKRRNTLFTAITRSRAWVRICGYGHGMEVLEQEFTKLRANHYKLSFKLPTHEELKLMRTQHRDMSPDERKKLSKVESVLSSLIAEDEESAILLENLPPGMKEKLLQRLLGSNDE